MKLVQRVHSRSFTAGCQESDARTGLDLFLSLVREFSKREWPYPKPMTLLQDALRDKDHRETIPDEWELRYIQHDWNVRWYLHSPNLLFHWQGTLFKLLLIRLLYQVHTTKSTRERFVEAVYSTERLVEHTSLKRDLYAMFSQPWSFRRWIHALL